MGGLCVLICFFMFRTAPTCSQFCSGASEIVCSLWDYIGTKNYSSKKRSRNSARQGSGCKGMEKVNDSLTLTLADFLYPEQSKWWTAFKLSLAFSLRFRVAEKQGEKFEALLEEKLALCKKNWQKKTPDPRFSYKWFFIGPRSDHSLPMSGTHWLTHWLTDDLLELMSRPCWRWNE